MDGVKGIVILITFPFWFSNPDTMRSLCITKYFLKNKILWYIYALIIIGISVPLAVYINFYIIQFEDIQFFRKGILCCIIFNIYALIKLILQILYSVYFAKIIIGKRQSKYKMKSSKQKQKRIPSI